MVYQCCSRECGDGSAGDPIHGPFFLFFWFRRLVLVVFHGCHRCMWLGCIRRPTLDLVRDKSSICVGGGGSALARVFVSVYWRIVAEKWESGLVWVARSWRRGTSLRFSTNNAILCRNGCIYLVRSWPVYCKDVLSLDNGIVMNMSVT